MSDYGVFEASSTDGHEEEQQQRQAQRDLGRAIEAAREAFGEFLAGATDKQDYKDRLALVMNDLMQSVADSGVMPVPGVMRKVKAALRPEFRKSTGARAVPYLEAYPDSTATGDEWTIVDESGNPLVKDQGDGGGDVPYHFRSEDAAEEAAQKLSRSSHKHADDHLDAPGVDMSQLKLDGTGTYGDAVAVAFDDSGNAVDLALNWETAQTLAQEGYDVQVVRGDGGRSQDEIQRMVDYEKELRRDLFGSRESAFSKNQYVALRKLADAGFDPDISDENLLAGLQIAEALNHDGSNQAKVDELRAEARLRGILATRKTASRSLSEIAAEIRDDWKNVYFGAEPYLDAMSSLDSIDDSYGQDSASSIVAYFLSNATSWRGETARRVKKELKELSKRRAHKTALKWKDTDFNSWVKMDGGAWSLEIEEVGGDFWVYFNGGPADGQMEQLSASSMEEAKAEAESIASSKGITASRKQAHNGWSNYETWEVASILDNDETAQQELAQGVSDVTHLRDIGEFYAQGNGIDFGQVDWQEIYDSFRGDGVFAKRKTADQWDDAVAAAIADGGFTFRNAPGDGPTSGYMVSTNPESERVIPTSQVTPQAVRDYIDEFSGALSSPDKYIGGWDDGGTFYLDISTHVQDKEEAIELSKQYNQLAIWDIAANDEIRTASLKQAGSAQVLQKLEDALDDQRNVDVVCSNSPDGSFSGEREIPVDEGLQKVRGWVSAGDLVDTAQDGGNFFDFEHRASGENVNFYITQEY